VLLSFNIHIVDAARSLLNQQSNFLYIHDCWILFVPGITRGVIVAWLASLTPSSTHNIMTVVHGNLETPTVHRIEIGPDRCATFRVHTFPTTHIVHGRIRTMAACASFNLKGEDRCTFQTIRDRPPTASEGGGRSDAASFGECKIHLVLQRIYSCDIATGFMKHGMTQVL
jgi:hypothetical protein